MSHIIGRGRYARETYPQPPSVAGGAACDPLFRTSYVDRNTEVDPADQDGSICAPFDTIQKALDAIPTPPDLNDVADLFPPFVVLIAPGPGPGNLVEDLTLPAEGYSLHLRGLGGGGPSETVDPSLLDPAAPLGPPVIVDQMTLTLGALAWGDPPAALQPSYQFESLASEQGLFLNADDVAFTEEGEQALRNTTIIIRRCSFFEIFDESGGAFKKWLGAINVRESTVAIYSVPASLLLGEHSNMGIVEARATRSHDCVIDDLELGDQGAFPDLTIHDTVITALIESTDPGSPAQFDAVTSFYVKKNEAIDPAENRIVTEDNSNAFLHTSRDLPSASTAFIFPPSVTFARLISAGPGTRAVTLPSISDVAELIGGDSIAQQRIVCNHTSSGINTVTVQAAPGNSIQDGNPVLTAGQCIILVPINTTQWQIVAKAP